ncbi:metal ABC transporter solute-binding protein, Zn/Mn family [Domibacillus mangrovi]|uniref:Adhesin n=1 Tax=Domibacillus mangrovi TaxID=1714354 RepID=A0A1Q5P3S1_9BACI|nr:zinc ABC transporter substrate-binding protein [Domibacillus mangrovi]OKL36772.1 adhesin [Domibacillus mangrovi]
MRKWAVIAAVMSLALAACSNGEDKGATSIEKNEDSRMTVYTTIYPLEYFAERIGGDTVNVESIMPAGADEHTYEPTTKTILELAKADLFLYNGLNLEPFAEKVEETLTEEDVKIVNIGEHVDVEVDSHEGHSHADEHMHEGEITEDGHDHDHGGVDPHIWIDPMLAIEIASVVKDELVTLNPDDEGTYNENFKSLKTDLESLDEKFHVMTEAAAHKEILVSHAAYGYWEKSYGIEQISIAGLSPTEEPSQKELKEIADTAREHGIKYVIFEQNITPKLAKVIQNEIGADSLRLHNLATLTEEDIENGDDYFSIMEQNIETLNLALSK